MLMFDLVPQTTNKQPTRFLFPPPTMSSLYYTLSSKMSIVVHSSAIPVHSGSIPVDSCPFLQIPVPFLWTPADASGMGSFLQESVGHGEVLVDCKESDL